MREEKKKHHPIRNILIILLILILLPIILLYAFCYDTHTFDFTPEENFNTQTLMQKKLVHSFDDTKTSGALKLDVTQDDLNNVLFQVRDSLPEQVKNHIRLFAIDITDDNYVFYVDLKASIFQTQLKLYTKLSEEKDATNPMNGYFAFAIEDAQIGRLHGFAKIAVDMVKRYISDEQLTKVLSETGLHMEADLGNQRILYRKSNISSDILNLFSSSNSSTMASSFLSAAFQNDLLDLNPNENDALVMNLSLSKFADNQTYTDTTKKLNADLSSYPSQMNTLLSDNIIAATQDEMNKTMDYLLKGYEKSSDDVKSYVQDKDFSSIGIQNTMAYTGVTLGTETEIDNILTSQFNKVHLATFTPGKIAELTETEIGYAILQSGIFGKSYVFFDQNKDSSYTINYLTVDDAYCQILDNALDLIVGININGYETVVVLSTDASTMQDLKINLTVKQLFYGEVKLNDDMKNFIYGILESSLSDSSWASFNKESGILTLNIEGALQDSLLKAALDTGVINKNSFTGNMVGSSLGEEGHFDIFLNL